MSAQDPTWRAQISTASLDPFRGYATALRASLPEAVRVLDAFQVVRLGQAVVDDVRRRRQQETVGRRGHREDPLYRGRRPLRRGFTTLDQRQWTRLELTLTLGDPSGQLTQAWMVALELQLLYARSHDLVDAKHRLWRILNRCARSDVPGLLRLARARRLVRPAPRLLDLDRPARRQQRPTEATNALIKKVKRVGHGFATSTTTASGCCSPSVWTGEPCTGRLRLPTPIRGRSPRLVA